METQVTEPTLIERAAVMASQFINGCDDGMDPNDVASLLLEQAQEIARLESQLSSEEAQYQRFKARREREREEEDIREGRLVVMATQIIGTDFDDAATAGLAKPAQGYIGDR